MWKVEYHDKHNTEGRTEWYELHLFEGKGFIKTRFQLTKIGEKFKGGAYQEGYRYTISNSMNNEIIEHLPDDERYKKLKRQFMWLCFEQIEEAMEVLNELKEKYEKSGKGVAI